MYGISEFRSIVKDKGQSWSFLTSQPDFLTLTLAIDPAGRTLYAGTFGGGVEELAISGRTEPLTSSAAPPRVRRAQPRS
ncbi:MAG: hypothetical protein ABI968_11140 [Acidobacteriota bacterium]